MKSITQQAVHKEQRENEQESISSQAWQHRAIIPALRKLRQDSLKHWLQSKTLAWEVGRKGGKLFLKNTRNSANLGR